MASKKSLKRPLGETLSYQDLRGRSPHQGKFVTGFDEAKLTIRQLMMKGIASNPTNSKRLELGCEQSSTRNIDAYLDMAVYCEGNKTRRMNGIARLSKEGTERGFNFSTNDEWLVQTRPILEAFWHTKYFVTMMIKYAKELESAPQMLPSDWAAVLYLFELH